MEKGMHKTESMATIIACLRRAGIAKPIRAQIFDKTVPDDALPDNPVVQEARSLVKAVRSVHG